jgi:hypothetical protein
VIAFAGWRIWLLGSVVFATLERPRPEWLHGIAFAFVVSLAAAELVAAAVFAVV